MRARRTSARSLSIAAVLLATASMSCGMFGDPDELLSFSVPLTWTVPATLPIAYPGSDRITELQNNNEQVFPIFAYVPADLQGVDDRITSSSVVDEVRITGVDVMISDNTLETELQPFEIRIGDPGTEVLGAEVAGADWNNALVIAVTETAAPGFTGTIEANIISENQSPAGRKIADLQFGIGLGTELVIPQGDFRGGGTARAQFKFYLDFVIKPL